jgi:hypothetical protein
MRKIISIVFANLILFQSFHIGFDDIVKIDDLLEHASYHQETYGDTFFEFLAEHYTENAINHDEDHEEHDNLPFKHDGKTCQHTTSIFTLHFNHFEIKPNQGIEHKAHFFYQDLYAFLNKPSVFQPPRQA